LSAREYDSDDLEGIDEIGSIKGHRKALRKVARVFYSHRLQTAFDHLISGLMSSRRGIRELADCSSKHHLRRILFGKVLIPISKRLTGTHLKRWSHSIKTILTKEKATLKIMGISQRLETNDAFGVWTGFVRQTKHSELLTNI